MSRRRARRLVSPAEAALGDKIACGLDVTLVLGAGVSAGTGIPTWPALASRLCRELRVAVPPALHETPTALHPLALPIAFELAERAALRGRAPAPFAERLRSALYRELAPASPGDTLATLAALLRREQPRERRRIRRVVTFNADDLLETRVNDPRRPYSAPVAWPVTHEAGRVRTERGARGRPPVPVYHVHGFLPRAGSAYLRHEAVESLVFTEAQYWASFSEPTSFPNRVLLNALHDSVCVFVGLSMTDLNIARWLGLRFNSIRRDYERRVRSPRDARRALQASLGHHFWIRATPAADSAEAFVTPILITRGVQPIDLPGWGAPLAALVERLFP
jgi:hypothetical protein